MKKIFTSLFSLFLLFGAMNAVAAEYPFKVTTDAENPELYAIKSGRGDAYWWTYNPTDSLIFLSAYAYDDSQYWYFMEVTEGEATYLQLYPALGEGKAMGYKDTSAGAAKVWSVTPGTEGYDCRWIFDNNGGKAPYGLKTSNGSIWLSNYGGAAYKMGFWTNGPAGDGGSAMYFEPVNKNAATLGKAAKLLDVYALQKAYGLVTEASKFSSNAVEPKEGALANLLDNNYSTFFHSSWSQAVNEKHYLQAEVSEPVESFIFYFKKRHNNNNNRPTDLTILGSTDGETFTEVANINSGFPTTEAVIDYMSDVVTASEAYKHFRFVINTTNNNGLNNGYAFFTFSEFYMLPASTAVLNALEMMDVANYVLAADEESAYYDALLAAFNALNDVFAAGEDIAAAKEAFEAVVAQIAQEKLDNALTVALEEAEAAFAAADTAAAPAIGQYSVVAYNAFEAAIAEAKAETATQESIDALKAATKAFYMAKNMPVFTINGVFSYVDNKYIYDNNSGTLYFNKNKDLADETMLWAFDMDTTAVGVTESVVVRNLATGNLFWNSASLKIVETAEANAEDGIFCFHVDHQDYPVHARQSDNAIITWNTNAATSASAWVFTYVGTTYDLYDLSAFAWADVTADVVKNADLAATDNWVANGGGYAHNAGKRVAEFYAGWGALDNTAGSLLQEVTLPAGNYRLTAKAFYRFGEAFNTNAAKSLGYLVAGDNKVAVKTLGSVAGLDAYANSIDEASAAFYEKDLYTNVLEFSLAEETTLNLGFECTHEEMRSWFIVGDVKLESATDVPGALKAQFEEQAMAFCSYGNMAMYSLQGVMARWEAKTATVWDVYSAISNGEKMLDAKVEKLIKEMADMMVEFDEISEYFAEFQDIKYGCYDIQDNSGDNTAAEVIAAFEEVVALTFNTANIATLADLKALTATLIAGRNEYVLNAVPNEGYTFDYTFLIEGVGNSIDGWVKNIEGFVGNFVYKHSAEKNTAELQKTGFIEAWNPNAYNGTISYTANVPNGYYKISAYTFANGATAFYANDKSAAVTSDMYVQPILDSVYVYNGKLEFGLNVENANWVGITNIELAFIAPKPAVEVATVTLSQTEATLEIAGEDFQSVQLVATVAPYDADDMTITWTSSDEAVATVDANGVVTAVAPGTATITATAANGVSATCVVTVVYAEGIETIEAEENAVIYTITGKSVQGSLKSLERGIYIVNGKKVYVK
ncbi:MAG: Ig-like domain-containing protein [Bacteroidaceae bacterium]|nr:Ig-like domain-containing protein [Bacteroidaceae bacterium]